MRKSINDIFNLISAEPGTNKKMEILGWYKENPILKQVLYLANSPRIKFYLKQIPAYTPSGALRDEKDMPAALKSLEKLYKRELTGHAASDFLKNLLESLSFDDATVIERIIEKDCKIGMGTTNINKIFPKLIENTPYMGAKAFDKDLVKALFMADVGKVKGGIDAKKIAGIVGADVPNTKKAFSQIKMDGRYCNAIIHNGRVELESREGESNPLEDAPFVEELKLYQNCVLNGELTMDGYKRYVSNGIIASLIVMNKKKNAGEDFSKEVKKLSKEHGLTYNEAVSLIRYTVWDVISLEEYEANESKVPYFKRLKAVERLISSNNSKKITLIYSREVSSYQEAIEHFQEVLVAGEEGTIVKAIDGEWKDGKPNWQVKLKLEMHVD